MALITNRPLVWRIYDDSDDDDRDDFLIKEIRCCECFLDRILAVIEEELTFEKIYRKLRVWKGYNRANEIYMFFSEISIFCCEESKIIFEQVCGFDKEQMDVSCQAARIDYCCLYFLTRETWMQCICEGCRRTILKLVSGKLIKIKI